MQITDINTIFGAYPSEHADSTADTLIKEMAAHDITRSLTLSTWGIYYREGLGNEHTLRAQQHFAGKLIAAATISPHSFFSDATVDLLIEQPFALFRFFPEIQDWPIDYAPFHQMLKVLADHQKPIMVTTRTPGQATVLARVAAGYSGPIILEGVGSKNMAEALCVLQVHDNFFVETHQFTQPGALETFRDRIGIERILFGSGGPALSVGSALAYIESSTLTDDEKAAVLSLNADRQILGVA
jgi:predicted TIM-barrel fold metal-dependent hydrolase